MKVIGLTLAFGALSAVVPFFNMEAYIVVAYAKLDQPSFLLAFIGSLGQNIGKLVWYYTCRGSLNIPYLQRRLGTPKRQAQLEKWSAYVNGRPVVAGLLTFLSALTGIPPFFAMAMIAGTLRFNVVIFFAAGLVGRTLFFWAILAGAHLFLG